MMTTERLTDRLHAEVAPDGQVTLVGEIDISTAPLVESALSLARRRSISHVIVDAHGVTFCDAAGVSALVSAQLKLRRRRARVVIRHSSPALQRIMHLSELTTEFSPDLVSIPSPASRRIA